MMELSTVQHNNGLHHTSHLHWERSWELQTGRLSPQRSFSAADVSLMWDIKIIRHPQSHLRLEGEAEK